MAANKLTERYVTGIRDNHLAHVGTDPRKVDAEDRIISIFVTGLHKGLPGMESGTVGEALIHTSVELAALSGALRQNGYSGEESTDILINILGLVGVRMYVGAELGGPS